ncbi:MAG TPA: hypothetical protein VEW04_02740 [Allosphingosinicella sp.]|nr:hypothetical protein [Allosphingosinicella sp.]
MFAGIVLLTILVMKLFPRLPFSRLLHECLVEAPLRNFAAMGRRHLIYAAVLVALTFSAGELILLFGSADIVTLMAWDVSFYVDAVVATWTMSALLRGKEAWGMLTARLPRPQLARRRAPRRRRAVRLREANDADEDGRGYARAA